MGGTRKNPSKRLHKGKKIEAKKPLFTPAEHAGIGSSGTTPTENVTFEYGALSVKYSSH